MISNVTKKKGEILAEAIISRDFDIPSNIYDLIDEYTVDAVLNHYDKDKCLNMFLTNKAFYGFCEYVRDLVDFRKYIFLSIIQNHSIWKGLFVFAPSDWYKLESLSYSVRLRGDTIEEFTGAPGADEDNPFTEEEVTDAIRTVIMTPELHDQIEYIYRFTYMKFEDFLYTFVDNTPARYLVNVLSYLDVGEHYKKTMACIEHGVPVLYKHYDCTELYLYLQTIINTNYTGKLDPTLAEIGTFIEANKDVLMVDEILGMLWNIGSNLNQNNLKYYYIAAGKIVPDTQTIIGILSNTDSHVIVKWGYLKNFKDLLIMLGRNQTGYSIELQKLFLQNGGDITTMIDDEYQLYPEASIIKATDMIPFLFQIMNDDDLWFMLQFSPEFIKNLMTSTWVTREHLMRVLDVLFTIPVDDELWNVLYNPTGEDEFTDYRAVIVNRIIAQLSKDFIITTLPKSVAYIEPTILFVSKNMTEEYIKFFPVTKIAPLLKNIISRRGYTKFNLFCGGTTVSIAKAIGDTQFIIDTLVRDKKYGYLCDMEGEDVEQILDTIVKHLGEEEE